MRAAERILRSKLLPEGRESSASASPPLAGCAADPVCEVNLAAVEHNLNVLRSRLQSRTGVIAVVKADAYGHGAVQVAGRLAQSGVQNFAVATVSEGAELREGGISGSIIVLVPALPSDMEVALRYRLTASLGSLKEAKLLSALAAHMGLKARAHLMIDTGLRRGGFLPSELPEALAVIRTLPSLEITGAWGHFATVTPLREARSVVACFRQAASVVLRFFPNATLHLASSLAAWLLPESHFDFIRPGLGLYGYLPGRTETPAFRPALRLKAPVIAVKRYPAGTAVSYEGTYRLKCESTIVTLRCGYADGYPFQLSNTGFVVIRGKRCPVAGRVTMDQLLVDVGDAPIEVGETATVLGPPGLLFSEAASRAGTIPYTILTAAGRRVRRVFVEDFALRGPAEPIAADCSAGRVQER